MFSGYEDNYILPFGCQKDFLIILGGIMIHYSSVQGQEMNQSPKACLNCLYTPMWTGDS